MTADDIRPSGFEVIHLGIVGGSLGAGWKLGAVHGAISASGSASMSARGASVDCPGRLGSDGGGTLPILGGAPLKVAVFPTYEAL